MTRVHFKFKSGTNPTWELGFRRVILEVDSEFATCTVHEGRRDVGAAEEANAQYS